MSKPLVHAIFTVTEACPNLVGVWRPGPVSSSMYLLSHAHSWTRFGYNMTALIAASELSLRVFVLNCQSTRVFNVIAPFNWYIYTSRSIRPTLNSILINIDTTTTTMSVITFLRSIARLCSCPNTYMQVQVGLDRRYRPWDPWEWNERPPESQRPKQIGSQLTYR